MKTHQLINNKTNNMMQQPIKILPTFKRINITLKKNYASLLCTTLLCLSLILTSQTAHADFRKALTSYQNRDGKTMLTEVQDAVDNKNDEGLVLFISAIKHDRITSKKTSLTTSCNKTKICSEMHTTFETILDRKEQARIVDLINTFEKLLKPDAQFQLLYESQIISTGSFQPNQQVKKLEDIANKGSVEAIRMLQGFQSEKDLEKDSYWMHKAAKYGNTEAQMALAFKYLHYVVSGISASQEECKLPDNATFCLPKDEVKGLFWLREAIKSSLVNQVNLRIVAFHTANILNSNILSQPKNPTEIYRWYLVGLNSPDFGWHYGVNKTKFIDGLQSMYDSGDLKIASSKLAADWENVEKRNQHIYLKEIKQLPTWLVRQKIKNHSTLIYENLNIASYRLSIYKDGKVDLALGSEGNFFNDNRIFTIDSSYLKTTPSKIKKFIKELNQLDFENWQMNATQKSDSDYYCDTCPSDDHLITFNQGIKEKSVYLGYPFYLPESYTTNKNIDFLSKQRAAKLVLLLEKYFPTIKLRCELGNSVSYKDACILQNQMLVNLSK
jgi:hypothetical protein